MAGYRTTTSELQGMANRLNHTVKKKKDEPGFFMINGAYGGHRLVRKTQCGEETVIHGFVAAGELRTRILAFMKGLEIGMEVKQ